MARLVYIIFVSATLTAVFGYPSSVPSVQDLPAAATSTKLSDGSQFAADPRAEEAADPQGPMPVVADGRGKRKASEDESSDSDDDNDDSDMFMEPQETDEEVVKVDNENEEAPKEEESSSVRPRDNHGMGQHFFPSFAPVFSLGHSRPPQLFHHENYYSKSRSPPPLGPDYNPFRAYRESSYKVPITLDDDPTSSNILGSGNFGVLKGGTYYNDEDRGELGLFNPYYNNGHGRPYSANPRPQKYSNGDFFANFRDFADINTPNKGSFSEYVIVYVNKNASKSDEGMETVPPGKVTRPKNIIEQLSMLDNYPGSSESEDTVPEKKTSLHKRKLALLQQERANKERKSYLKKKEPLEPLLALS